MESNMSGDGQKTIYVYAYQANPDAIHEMPEYQPHNAQHPTVAIICSPAKQEKKRAAQHQMEDLAN